MSEQPVSVHAANLTSSITRMLVAHDAIKEGIATHAERHRAAKQAQYHEMELQQRMAEGAAAHAANIQSASK